VLAWVATPVIGFRSSLQIVTGVSLVLVIVGVFAPQLGLLGVALLSTLDAPARAFLFTGGLLRWNTFNYILLGVTAISLPLLFRLRGLTLLTLCLLLGVLSLGLVITPDPVGGVLHLVNLTAMFGLLAYFLRAGRRPDTWYWMGVVCGVAAALGSLMFYLNQAFLPYLNKNAWATFPVTAIFAAALAFPSAGRPRRQAVLGALVIFNAAWVFLSGSRGNLFTAVCCAIFLVGMLRRFESRAIFVAAVPLLVVAISAQFTEMQEFALHMLDKLINPAASLANRTSGRSDLAIGGWYIFKDHLLGVGTGGFSVAWQRLTPETGVDPDYLRVATEAHSAWVKTLAENGVPGVVALAAFILSFSMTGWNRGHEARYLGLLVTAALALAFVSTEFQSKGVWFLAAGATVVLLGSSVRSVPRSQPPARRRQLILRR
jgi:hypothetical protein